MIPLIQSLKLRCEQGEKVVLTKEEALAVVEIVVDAMKIIEGKKKKK